MTTTHWDRIEGETAPLRNRIHDVLITRRGEWLSNEELTIEIYGSGPYSYSEAVGLNKIATWSKRLADDGLAQRATNLADGLLRYRVP